MNPQNPLPQLLQNQTVLIMGVANEWSLAWGIAEICHNSGANIILTYPNATMEKRIKPLADKLKAKCLPCDVQNDSQIIQLAKALEGTKIDALVHAIAFADKNELKGGISQTSRAGFTLALEVSCYSLISLMKHLAPRLSLTAKILTLTYEGSTKVVNNYNIMGVAKAALEATVRYLAAEIGPQGQRVNALSAGPINTLAARGITDFSNMLKHHEKTAPLRRLTTQDDVAKAALYLLSDLSSGVTGTIHLVDTGAHLLGPIPSVE